MKKTTVLLIVLVLVGFADALTAGSITGTRGTTPGGGTGPDAASTSLLLGAAASGLYGLRRFLKK